MGDSLVEWGRKLHGDAPPADPATPLPAGVPGLDLARLAEAANALAAAATPAERRKASNLVRLAWEDIGLALRDDLCLGDAQAQEMLRLYAANWPGAGGGK